MMKETRAVRKIKKAVIKAIVESGFEGVRTRDIAKNAKTSEALIFRYFKDKNDLIKKTFIEVANNFYDYIKTNVESVKDEKEKLNKFIDSFIDFALSNSKEFLFVLKMYQFHYDRFIRKTPKPIDILKEIAPNGKYGKDYTVSFIVSILTRMLEFYINGQIKDRRQNLVKKIKEVISYIL